MTDDEAGQRGGILSGLELDNAVCDGRIEIVPYSVQNLNPNSYDLHLGDEIKVYDDWTDDWVPESYLVNDGDHIVPRNCVIDVKKEPKTRTYKIPERGFILRPGIGYLAHTLERITTDSFVPILDGKSSLARLFAMVHFCAGYGDVGFSGQYTLEMSVMSPLRIYAGMKICQIRFHTIYGKISSYADTKSHNSHYLGDNARGAVPSMIWKTFEPK